MDKLLEARYQERKIFSRRGAVNSTSPFHTWKQVLILSIFFSMKLQPKKKKIPTLPIYFDCDHDFNFYLHFVHKMVSYCDAPTRPD